MTRTFKDIEYTLIKRHRKTASIHIERDGKVTLIVPKTLTTTQVEELLEVKRKWIYQNLAEWKHLNAKKVRREYVNGEGFLYLGRSYRLKLVPSLSEPLLLKDGYFCLSVANASGQEGDTAFKEFYRAKGAVHIPPRVEYFRAKLDVEPKMVKVIDLKNRWASCTPDGNLNFHWKCMMAPLTILDYIVAHELVHLIHSNHTASFWNELDKVMPDYQNRKDWLRDNGVEMDL